MTRVIVFVVILLFLLPGCLFDGGSDNIVDDYDVNWVDVSGNRSIHKVTGEGLVPPSVFAAGHDKRYVFVKQRPYYWDSNDKIDKNIVNYYIIERTKSELQDKPKYGPLPKKVFDSLYMKLGIENPEFDMTYSY